jgi:hypothetical protein
MDDINTIKKDPDMVMRIIKTKIKTSGAHTRKIILILILLVVVLGGTSFYFYRNSQLAKHPGAAEEKEAKALASKVGKLIILPEDEVPTIATVSDPEALKNQSFFADAKKGDKVLIYSKAQKAILYSPSVNKIVTVAPLSISNEKPTPDSSAIPKPVTDPAASSVKKNQF